MSEGFPKNKREKLDLDLSDDTAKEQSPRLDIDLSDETAPQKAREDAAQLEAIRERLGISDAQSGEEKIIGPLKSRSGGFTPKAEAPVAEQSIADKEAALKAELEDPTFLAKLEEKKRQAAELQAFRKQFKRAA